MVELKAVLAPSSKDGLLVFCIKVIVSKRLRLG